MADLSKLKGKVPKNRFGTPPQLEEAGSNLEAPEHAPNNPNKKTRGKTGRTQVFSTRVTKEFLKEFKTIAFQDDLKLVELLEVSFKSYKEEKDK